MNCSECNNPQEAPRAHAAFAQPNRDSRKSGSERIPTGTRAEYQETAEEEHQCDNQTDFCAAFSHETPLKSPNEVSDRELTRLLTKQRTPVRWTDS